MNKIDHNDPISKSANIVDNNIEQLKQLFPEIFKENKIDWDELKATLGEHIDTENERFNFTWNGKTQARKEAQKPSTGTLRPCKEDSVDWDNTKNLYIEGDNLEVLKILQKSYHQKVKMIYIDPPYNTGKDFVYKDNYKDNLSNYLELTGQTDEDGKKLSTNSDASGRYHSNWLNMMYPRLKLARNLLTDDGVIFISIDDNEVANLRKLCDEIFGEENYVQEIIWEKKFSPQNDAKYFSLNHEQILCYSKNKTLFKRNLLSMTEDQVARYKNPDNDPRGVWQSDNFTVATYNQSYDFPITKPNGEIANPTNGRCWATSEEKYFELLNDKRIWFGVNGTGVPRIKRYLSEVQQGRVPISIFSYSEVGHTQEASQEVKAIFDDNKYFDYPKPVRLLKQVLHIGTSKDDLVLDFFSGSGTMAHAIIQLNIEDGGNRKHIQVQLPEPTDVKSDAYKAGYKTIAEIGKERIRRAGKKIQEENSKKAKDLDIGFKVFKLDSSNIKTWSADADSLEEDLFNAVDNIKADRTENDLLFEILLKYGLDLTLPITEHKVNDVTIYSVGLGALIVCFSDNINVETAVAIAKLKEKQNPEICRVVFKDSGFATDTIKTNVLQKLKQYKIEEVRSI